MKYLFSYIFDLTLKAGLVLKEAFNQDYHYEMKNKREIVTDIDKQIEDFYYNEVKKEYKKIKFLAEEEHFKTIDLENTIILDPIDGTNNFYYKLPFVAISIAYYKNGIGEFGIVYNPILEEMFIGMRNEGSFLNGLPIEVSKTKELINSLLATGLPYNRENDKENNLENIKKIGKKCRDIRRFGSAALDICYVAKGTFDGYWELQLKPWDVAAASIIAKEAGATLSNFNNDNIDIFRNDFLITNGLIHEELKNILKEGIQ